METSNRAVVVETFGKRAMACTMVGFFTLIGLCAAIGALGPAVMSSSQGGGPLTCENANCTVTWRGRLTDMGPLNQVLFLEAQIHKPSLRGEDNAFLATAFEYQQELVVTLKGRQNADEQYVVLEESQKTVRDVTCPAGGDLCNKFVVLSEHFIEYAEYFVVVDFIHPTAAFHTGGMEEAMEVDFTLNFVAKAYTSFEIGFKAAFFGLTFLITVAYMCLMCRMRTRREWSYEQKWVGALLAGLLLFNDPLFAMEVYSPSFLLSAVYAVWLSSFISSMLFFWLSIVDIVRSAAHAYNTRRRGADRRGLGFYMPKVVLIMVFWFSAIAVYMYVRVEQSVDPAFDVSQTPYFKFFSFFVLAMVTVYILWMIVLVCMAFREMKSLAPPFQFVFLLSLFTMIVMISGIITIATMSGDTRVSAAGFLLFYGIFNVYVWTLAFAYSPAAGSEDDEDDEQEQALELTMGGADARKFSTSVEHDGGRRVSAGALGGGSRGAPGADEDGDDDVLADDDDEEAGGGARGPAGSLTDDESDGSGAEDKPSAGAAGV